MSIAAAVLTGHASLPCQVVAALAALAAGAPVSSLASLLAPQMLQQDVSDQVPSAEKVQAMADDDSSAAGGRVGRQQRRQRKQREGAVAAVPAGPDAASAMHALPPVDASSAPQLTQPATPAVSAAGAVAPVTAGGMQVTAGFEVTSVPQSAAAASSAVVTLAVQPPARKAAKPPRKGGLSLFLRGDLDKEASSPAAASVAPAAPRGWGLPAAAPAAAGAAPPLASGLVISAMQAALKGWGAPAAALAPSAPASGEGPAISGGAKSGHSSVADPQVSSLTAGLARQRLEADAHAPEGVALSLQAASLVACQSAEQGAVHQARACARNCCAGAVRRAVASAAAASPLKHWQPERRSTWWRGVSTESAVGRTHAKVPHPILLALYQAACL